MRFIDTFDKHRSRPEETVDAYFRELRIELGQKLRDVRKVYLDTKYWILLREARLGRSNDLRANQLYDVLKNGVYSGSIICPISDYLYVELLGQADPLTLRATAELVDDLSKGIALASSVERMRTEVVHWVFKCIYGEDAIHAIEELVWIKATLVLGFLYPTNTPFSPDEERMMQKAFLDQLWNISFSDMLDVMGNESIRRMPQFSDISQKLNEGKIAHAHENKSFKELLMSELGGVIDLLGPEFEEMVALLYQRKTGQVPTVAELRSADIRRWFSNMIYHVFRLNKITREMAMLRIGAGLHASVRWDGGRKYHPNDMADFGHAQAALPYCDYFLTEHNLRDLITKKSLSYDRLYDCRVISHVDEALEALSPGFR